MIFFGLQGRCRSPIEKVPSIRAVQPTQVNAFDVLRIAHARVHAHAVIVRLIAQGQRQPIKDATARQAAMRRQRLIALDIGLGRAGQGDFIQLVICPARAQPPAQRAIAVAELRGLLGGFKSNRAAMTGAMESHG